MLNTAVTKVPKFSSSGREWSPLPFTSCSTTALLLGVEASMLEGIARHLQDLTGAAQLLSSSVRLRGAKQHLPHLPVCTVLSEHCASCSTS